MLKRLVISVTCCTLFGSAAWAQSAGEKQCVLLAAQNLPRIPGISIVSSRTGPVAEKLLPLHRRPKDADTMLVEIDAKAAGVDTTVRFLCVATHDGRAAVERVP